MSKRRIGIVTPDHEHDWASAELLAAADALAEAVPVDPISFEVITDGEPSLRILGEPADSLDALIIRGFNRWGEIDYQYEVFELFERLGKVVINSPAGLSLAESKSQTTYSLQLAGLPVPRTITTQEREEAVDALRSFGSAVAKPLYGSHGVGIERLEGRQGEKLIPRMLETFGAICIQEYIPNEGRDIRVFVVGDEIPAAMYRIAREGQWKTNVFQGSRCEPYEPQGRIAEISLEAARVIGLDYTGVDVIEGPDGPMILELNGAPSWYGLHDTTGRNVAMDIVRHSLSMIDSGRSARQPWGLPCPQQELPDSYVPG